MSAAFGNSFMQEMAGGDAPVQRAGQAGEAELGVQDVAQSGVSGGGGALPFLAPIQAAFGHHDVSGVSAHTDANAAAASAQIGASAYATGDDVAFGGAPDLHTAAHEAAHVVQQRGGVSLSGGVGQVGDKYEQHADAVADLVVQGKSAESLLDEMSGGGGGGDGPVQLRQLATAIWGGTRISNPSQRGVYARDTGPWRTFLDSEADETYGEIELATFLALATDASIAGVDPSYGQPSMSDPNSPSTTVFPRTIGVVGPSGSGRPSPATDDDAVALMVALMTTENDSRNRELNLEADSYPFLTSNLLSNFNRKYAGMALEEISESGDQRNMLFEGVTEYASDCDDIHTGRSQDANKRLIASSFGSAVRGVRMVLAVGDDRTQDDKKTLGYNLIRNSATAIRAVIEEDDEETSIAVSALMGVFQAVAGAALGFTGVGTLVAAAAVGAMSPVAQRFFESVVAGEGADARDALIQDFSNTVRRLAREGNSDPDDAEQCKDCFELRIK